MFVVLKFIRLVTNHLFEEIHDLCSDIKNNMSRMILFDLLSIFCLTVRIANAANILYLCALPSPSHHVWYILNVKICFCVYCVLYEKKKSGQN